MNGKKTRTPLNSPNHRRFCKDAAVVHLENSEFLYEDGKIVGTKAPNRKKIDNFYKKIQLHQALKARRK